MSTELAVPAVVALHDYKKADASRRMAKTFVAFVRVGRAKKKASGYIVFSANRPLRAFRHPNFVAFWAAPELEGLHVVNAILDSARQANRDTYLDENFHDSMVISAIGGCARGVMNDKNIPKALAFGLITVDTHANVTAAMGSGETLAEESVSRRAPKIVIAGCTDIPTRRAIKDLLTKYLVKGSGSDVARKKLAREIRKLTGLKMTGSLIVADES
ncbi:MAG: hypothetical protein KBC02_01085 [Candidatus Pacebacteria bacterium]|nr:hypothetical protein [Candidatus Paceibacterota bacterium]